MRSLRYFALPLLALATVAQAQITQKENTPPYTAATLVQSTDGQNRALSAPVVATINPQTGASANPTVAGQGSSTSGQSGTLAMCAVVTGNQPYTAGQTQPCNLTPTGRLKVGVSSATNINPAPNLTTTLDSDLAGCVYRAAQPGWSDGYSGAFACDNGGNLQTSSRGGQSIATGQISVGTTATLLVAPRPGRQKVTYNVTTAVQCSYGAAGVTLTTGFPLAAVAGAGQTLDTAAAVYAVCASAATVGYLEQY